MRRCARVAVARPVPEPLSYGVPPHLEGDIQVGTRCVVPLGRTRAAGIVVGFDPRPPVEGLRDILEVLDPFPALPADLVALGLWMAHYYVHPPGEALARMLPAALRPRARPVYRAGGGTPPETLSREERRLWERIARCGELPVSRVSPGERGILARLAAAGVVERCWRVDAPGPRRETWFRLEPGAPSPDEIEARSPRQAQALRALAEGPLPAWALPARGVSRDALRRAVHRGWVARLERPPSPSDPASWSLAPDAPASPRLTEAQGAVVQAVECALQEEAFRTVVLRGVTGSGKTEVYLRAAANALARGRGVLLLVPEIGLTPQLLGRVLARFGSQVAVLHSGLGEGERALQWERVRRGEARVVLGARSAVFAPLDRLGVVVVDEEHDAAYKQEEGLRYHAKHVALYRARQHGAVAILGSATPDVETLWRARAGPYLLFELPRRVGGAETPRIRLVDVRTEERRRGRPVLLSRPLIGAVEQALTRGEQILLFLNRRGFSPVLVCSGCGEALHCPRCAIGLTVHRTPGAAFLLCHYCGVRRDVPAHCPGCGEPALRPAGSGTQRLAEAVRARWPGVRVIRLDRDTGPAERVRAALEAFRRQEADILVGTQMVAKGHHFPRLTVVGVVDADQGLHFPDFRAAEFTFQMLTQVAGRAGREERPGSVFVQTRRPDHPVLQAVVKGDYPAFAREELAARRRAGYPPFRRLALIHVSARDADRAQDRALRLARAASGPARRLGVEILGPAPALIERLRGRWRYQLLLRAPGPRPGPLLRLLHALRDGGHLSEDRAVRVVVDVDPVSVL